MTHDSYRCLSHTLLCCGCPNLCTCKTDYGEWMEVLAFLTGRMSFSSAPSSFMKIFLSCGRYETLALSLSQNSAPVLPSDADDCGCKVIPIRIFADFNVRLLLAQLSRLTSNLQQIQLTPLSAHFIARSSSQVQCRQLYSRGVNGRH